MKMPSDFPKTFNQDDDEGHPTDVPDAADHRICLLGSPTAKARKKTFVLTAI
jgi:hypothetical protein